jgi:hypothetical protein
MVITSVFLLVLAAGCTSAPSETPENFVLNFINKHIPMIDASVADFYVKEEQKGVMERVQNFIASSKKKGLFESHSAATYDFSQIKITVLDQKEEFVNDEGVNFLKIAANGSYTKTVNGTSESLTEDEIIIIESIAGAWKVTEKTNPWK